MRSLRALLGYDQSVPSTFSVGSEKRNGSNELGLPSLPTTVATANNGTNVSTRRLSGTSDSKINSLCTSYL